MKRRVHQAPFALTTDGAVLLNVAMFDAPKDLAEQLRLAQSQSGEIFIGLTLTAAEASILAEKVGHVYRDGAAWLVGRQQRARRGSEK